MVSKKLYRFIYLSLIIFSLLAVVNGAASSSVGQTDKQLRQANHSDSGGKQVAKPRSGITVVATDSNTWMGNGDDGPRSRAELVGFNPDGSVLYYNDSHTRYWDVDPVNGTRATVEYFYADHISKSKCGQEACTRNGIERVNLSTGEVTPVFSRITPGKHSTRWHDGDRLNRTRYLVADIAQDRVFVVNTTTGLVEWSWDAQQAFDPKTSGGPYPEDWTHINDVEVVQNDRIMVSVRNHDQVIFLDRQTGLMQKWTLGSDNNHSVLYEQHNPDYIPAKNGGPAVLIGDSENNRVVEYQRENGSWNQSWSWQDSKTQWPRDADRLPNGHTLITDSNGNRVVEVNKEGEIVWAVDIAFPYEAERLGTGDESTGGQSAKSLGLGSKTATDANSGDQIDANQKAGIAGSIWVGIKNLIPGRYMNAVMYILPAWMGPTELATLLVAVLSSLAWAVTEWRWSERSLSVPWTIDVKRKQ